MSGRLSWLVPLAALLLLIRPSWAADFSEQQRCLRRKWRGL